MSAVSADELANLLNSDDPRMAGVAGLLKSVWERFYNLADVLMLAWARNNPDAPGMVLDACDQLGLTGSDRGVVTEAVKVRIMHRE